MKSSYVQRFVLVAFLTSPLMLTGCKSGMWKPSSMFSWGSDTPPETAELELPVSPANQYTPNAVSSVGAGASGAPATQKTPYGAPSDYSSPVGYTAGSTSTAPGAGLAAKANGYTGGYSTGPYSVGGSGTRNTPSTAAAYTSSASPSASLPNPYGGVPSNTVSTPTNPIDPPNITLPSSVKAAMSQSAPANYPSLPNMGATPAAASAMPAGSAPTSTSMPAYGTSSMPALPNAGTMPSLPTSTPSVGGPAVSGLPALPTTTSPSAPSGFAPGSTARPNSYNFGN